MTLLIYESKVLFQITGPVTWIPKLVAHCMMGTSRKEAAK